MRSLAKLNSIMTIVAASLMACGAGDQQRAAPPTNAERLQTSGCEVLLPPDKIRDNSNTGAWVLDFSSLNLTCLNGRDKTTAPSPKDIFWVQLILEEIDWPSSSGNRILIGANSELVQTVSRDAIGGDKFISVYLVRESAADGIRQIAVGLDGPSDQAPRFSIRRIIRSLTNSELGLPANKPPRPMRSPGDGRWPNPIPGSTVANTPDSSPVRLGPNDWYLRALSLATVQISGASDSPRSPSNPRSCTGFLVGRSLVLTNSHCVTRNGAYDSIACRNAYIWFDYLSDETSRGLKQNRCKEVIKENMGLDYSLLKLVSEIPSSANDEKRSPLCLASTPTSQSRETPILTTHHPLGREMHFQANCKMGTRAQTESLLEKMTANGISAPDSRDQVWAHSCGTEPGSSGAPLYDRQTKHVVALHFGTAYASDWDAERQIRFIYDLNSAGITTINTAYSTFAIWREIKEFVSAPGEAPECYVR